MPESGSYGSVGGVARPAAGRPYPGVNKAWLLSIGGMKTKPEAVRCAVDAGIETFIANGRKPERLPSIVKGTGTATRFTSK